MRRIRNWIVPALALGMQPLTTATALSFGAADLRVNSVDHAGVIGNWQTRVIGGSVDVEVENAGGDTSGIPVDLVLFEDSNDNGTYEPGTDLLLGSAVVPVLLSGETQVLTVPVAGTVVFRDNLIHAMVDSSDDVGESDETNNVQHSGEFCLIPPPAAGPLDPVLEWSWTSSAVEPTALNVMMTPSVIDVTADGIPDVIFGSTASVGGGLVESGYLRALNGADGTEIFTVNDPGQIISTTFSIAVGDIDNDGLPEILAAAVANNRLHCFENDGTLKWSSAPLEALNWGCASIADLDGDGSPEIVVGRQALDANGNLLWTGTGGRASSGTAGALSLVADVNLDGSPNVVGGNTMYNSDGTILWMNSVPDGHAAIANLDADPFPEIVHVASGSIWILSAESGAIQCGPVGVPGGGSGGPPTIADYDDDGDAEFGVAGASRYSVFESDCTLKWSSATQDTSSNRTGSSVFDFNGDGSAEVVYRDELRLRIYQGTDGTVIFETPMSSCTWHEYVLVADVDADGNSELVAVANNNCGFGSQRGVYVFGSQTDSWVPTRQIWNQHTYHITNINDDGTIPIVEANNWLTPAGDPYNNYRQNTLSDGLSPLSAPDLTASFIQLAPGSLTARIGNGGAVLVGAGIPVSFYDGDPSGAGVLIGTTATLGPLQPGEFEDVTLVAALPPTEVWVAADDSGGLVSTENECDEDNNVHGRTIRAPYFDSPLACGQTVVGEVGGAISFMVTAQDDDSGDVVTLSVVGAPAGATHTPVLPTDGNPVSTLFEWTPQLGDAGTYVITYTADDGALTDDCTVTLEVADVVQSIDLTPDSATNVVGSDHTVTATVTDNLGNPVVGTLVTFEVTAGPHSGTTDASVTDANGQAFFTYMGTIAGLDTIVGCFIDNTQAEQCDTVTKEWVAECFLAIGDSPGSASFTPAYHTLQTQLNAVDEFYPVLTTSLHEIVLPDRTAPTLGGNGGVFGNVGVVRSAYRTFAVEVLMYNEAIYPNNPEHHSNGLLVAIDSYGNVSTVPYGSGSMSVWAQTGVNSSGKRFVRFPFTMPQ